LLGLWWKLLLRRPLRLGHAPKRGGFPTFGLLNLIWIANTFGILYRSVHGDLAINQLSMLWHLLGLVLVAFATGLGRGALGAFLLRGTRADEFLKPLPLSGLARLGLGLADNYIVFLLLPAVPLAGAIAAQRSVGSTVVAVLQTFPVAVAFYIAGHATAAWARSLGGGATQRYVDHASSGAAALAALLLFAPLARFVLPPTELAWVTLCWLAPAGIQLLALPGGSVLLGVAAYYALRAAERRGFDQLDPQLRRPRGDKRALDRQTLERRLVWRLGGKAQLGIWVGVCIGAGYTLFQRPTSLAMEPVLFGVGLTLVYLGALQTVAQAGNAVRRDLAARNFLSALPLSPYQLLDGKANVLRIGQLPALVSLLCLAAVAAHESHTGLALRALLTAVALLVVASGAVSVAFLSHGVGVAGIGGGQGSSSFSTQLLMLPLFATYLAHDTFSASVSLLALAAVSWEVRRAAQRSVRWLDDADDAVERETSVWRALMAATAFYATQILLAGLLSLFEVDKELLLACSFGCGALVLGLLTRRSWTTLGRPSLMPAHALYWPLALFGGASTALLSIKLLRWLVPAAESVASPSSSVLQRVALGATVVLIAPVVEEYFFRGWLQRAIEQDLAAQHKRWAFALGALAFALAHVGTYGVPQLLLGLVAGALYRAGQGLGPAIVAHAAHNAVTLLWLSDGR
jgi:membrane protease YdiL (CAAX protease family)